MESSSDAQSSAAAPPPPSARGIDGSIETVRSTMTRRDVRRIIKRALTTEGIALGGHVVRARRHRLQFVTTCIERHLYASAPTFDAYADLETLPKRMAGVVNALVVQERRLRERIA